MKPKVIGLDMDGVLVDHARTVAAYLRDHNIHVDSGAQSFAQLHEQLDAATLSSMFDFMYESMAGAEASALMPGVEVALERLAAAGHSLYLLSRRNNSDIPQAMLERLGLWPTYFRSDNAFFVGHTSQKAEIAAKLSLSHYVDDQPKSLLTVLPAVPHKYLFDQFGSLGDDPAYTRVRSWGALAELLV